MFSIPIVNNAEPWNLHLCRGEPCVRPICDNSRTQGEHKVRPYGYTRLVKV